MSDTDLELLARYTRHHAEDAFAEIVRRRLPLVYSAALRQVRSPELAEEVAQSTFLKLAQHATRLAPDTLVSAWLYQVTRREAIDVVRREARRQLREQIATEMNALNATAAGWTAIEPLLDEAMNALDETDRAAVLLRYFENQPLREVGQRLGTSEDAAQKRVRRAVERLREFFAQRGVSVGASGFATLLSVHAVQAAPVGLAATIAGAVSAAGLAAPGLAVAATAGEGSGVFGSLLQASRTKLGAGVAVTALVGMAIFLAVRSHPLGKRDSPREGAGASITSAVQNPATAAAANQSNVAEDPGPADPMKLLLAVARARQRIVSGSMELQLFVERFENGRKEIRPPVRLQILFDGARLRFDSVERQYAYPFFDDYESPEAKEAIRRADSMAKEDAVRAGLLKGFEAHQVTACDGETLARFSESDGKNGSTTVDDPVQGSARSASYFFDPRCLGLTETLHYGSTIEACLGLNGPQSVQLLGEEPVEGVPAWRVQVLNQHEATLDFWIEIARPWRVLKQATQYSFVQSKYDGGNPHDPIPIEVTSLYTYANRPLAFSRRCIRSNAQFQQPIEAASFTLAGLGMPVGTDVNDVRNHRRLGYWTGAGVSESPLRKGATAQPSPQAAELRAWLEHAPATPEAFDAATWLLLNTPDGPAVEKAAEVLQLWHIENTNLVRLCQELERVRHRCSTNLLETLLQQNPSAAVRAHACYALATLRKDEANYGQNPTATAQAERLLQRVITEFGGNSDYGFNLAWHAGRDLDELRRLFIGKPAPETEGADLDGQPLRLSDYRGRVVVLTFWCPGYSEATEHRKLVARLAGQPFAFLGVFADDDLAKGKADVERYGISWPSFLDKRDGPISTHWLVRRWPSVYVLDRQGVIRHRNLRWGELDEAVDRLLAE